MEYPWIIPDGDNISQQITYHTLDLHATREQCVPITVLVNVLIWDIIKCQDGYPYYECSFETC